MIIVQCMNVIFGTMVASLLYYNEFVKTPKRTGFQLNPYGTCVTNIMVNDNHKTICFRVYYCKISHQDSEVNYGFINTLRDEYDSVF